MKGGKSEVSAFPPPPRGGARSSGQLWLHCERRESPRNEERSDEAILYAIQSLKEKNKAQLPE